MIHRINDLNNSGIIFIQTITPVENKLSSRLQNQNRDNFLNDDLCLFWLKKEQFSPIVDHTSNASIAVWGFYLFKFFSCLFTPKKSKFNVRYIFFFVVLITMTKLITIYNIIWIHSLFLHWRHELQCCKLLDVKKRISMIHNSFKLFFPISSVLWSKITRRWF